MSSLPLRKNPLPLAPVGTSWVAAALLTLTLLFPGQAGSADAPTTGQILANPHFETWNENSLAGWTITESGAVQKGPQAPSGGTVITLRSENTPFVDVKQVFREAPLLPGDTLIFEVRARCETPDAFQGLVRFYTAEKSQDIAHNIFHPGDGAWHTLTSSLQVPDAPLQNLTIGVRGTQSLEAPAEVAFARAYIVPQIP